MSRTDSTEKSSRVSLNRKDITITPELYYAVDYVDRFYIDRVLGKGEKNKFYSMRFLHQASVDR